MADKQATAAANPAASAPGETGTYIVKWWNDGQAYGFLHTPQGDAFVHLKQIRMDGYKTLTEGQAVTARIVESKKQPGKWDAEDVTPVQPAAARK